jgi:hypothetical protein
MAKNPKVAAQSRPPTMRNIFSSDFSEFSSVFTILFAAYSFFMVTFWAFYMKANPSEVTDKLLFVGAGVFALLVLGFALKFPVVLKNSISLCLALTSLSVGVIVKENQAMSREHVMGFGFSVFIIAIVLAMVLPAIVRNVDLTWVQITLTVVAIFFSVIAILSFWQTKNSLIESQHSEYVVNELLAPRTGYSQFSSFIPQYTFILGYFFKLIPLSVSYLTTIQIVVMTLTVMAFLSLLSAIYIGSRLLSGVKIRWQLAAIIIIPLTSVTAGWARISFVGPPTTLLSGPAIRVFSGMVLGVLLVSYLTANEFKRNKFSWPLSFGVLAGFSSAINLDFGIAAALALFITLVISIKGLKQTLKSIFNFGFGFVGLWLLVLGLLGSSGNAPMGSRFAWFIRQFGGGFGSVTISYPGPVMFALPTIFALMIFSGLLTLKNVHKGSSQKELFISVVTFYFAAWTFFSTPYYLNRSYHSGQMSTLYLSLSVAIVGLFAMLANQHKFSLKNKNFIIPAIIVSISVAAIWISPNPSIELKRIQGGNPDGNLPRAGIQHVIDSAESLKSELRTLGTFGYFGEEGNIVQLATGIESANIFNNPLDIFQNKASIELGCKILVEKRFDYLIITPTALQAFAWPDKSLCDGFYTNSFKVGDIDIAKKSR